MQKFHILVVIVVSFAWFSTCQDEFYDTVISDIGTTDRLYCGNVTEDFTYPNDSIPEAWMLPNLTVLEDGRGKYQLEDNKWTLRIENIQASDLGLYHCMMKTPESEWFLVRLGLNARGPYYANLWDEYELNTIIGLSAAGGFLVIVGVFYLIDRMSPNLCHQSNKLDIAESETGRTTSSGRQEKEIMPQSEKNSVTTVSGRRSADGSYSNKTLESTKV